jgi:hypothetical protein
MSRDWIEPKTLPLVRLIVARIDRRRYDVVVRPDRVIVSERPNGGQRCFYLVHQLEDFCAGPGAARQRAARRRGDETALPWRDRWRPRSDATIDEMINEIARLHEAVVILRGKRSHAERDRDRWERLARALEAELSAVRGIAPRMNGHRAGADKFRQAKKAVARLTHPDSTGATGIEATIREKLFKEFWAEFQRIEAEP